MNKVRKKLGIDTIHKNGIKGAGINTAVLDTGMYLHSDLKDRIICFRDFTGYSLKPYDDNSHGTHVCGIIAGSGEASDGMYTGIAPKSCLISIKVLGRNGTGNSSSMITGINWILDNMEKYDIRIVNISAGTTSEKCSDERSSLVKAVDAMWDAGITVIASAGNNGPKNNTITIPGISRKIITVGTNDVMWHTDSHGRINGTFSGKGPTHCNIAKPDIIAPGADIISCSNNPGSYTAKSGTSMSTPIVSGTAALIFSYNKSLTNNEFNKLLCLTATDAGLDRYSQGCGMINPSGLLLSC